MSITENQKKKLFNLIKSNNSKKLKNYIRQNKINFREIENNKLNSDLYSAMCNVSHETLSVLFDELNVNSNLRFNNNSSLLSQALEDKNFIILKQLFKQSFYLDENLNDNDHPLLKAILQNQPQTVFSLFKTLSVNKDNNLNIVIKSKNYGFTPLILSYILKRFEIFNFLMKQTHIKCCHLYECDNYGYHLFHYAILSENQKLIKTLMDSGMNMNDWNNKLVLTPLILSTLINNFSIFNTIISHNINNINKPNDQGDTPLMTFIRFPNITYQFKKNVIQRLLNKGADINFSNGCSNSPLGCAIQVQSLPLVRLLIMRGADVNTYYNNGEYPLVRAIREQSLPIVKELIRHGADCNTIDSLGKYALIYAIEQKNLSIINYILEYNEDIDYEDSNGKTALIYAIQEKSLPVIEIIADKGASMDYIDNNGKSPFIYAIKTGDINIIKYFQECEIPLTFGEKDVLLELVNFFSDIESNDQKCDIFFHLMETEENMDTDDLILTFLKKRKFNIIKLLINNEWVEINDDYNGVPFFIHALKTRNYDFIHYLLDCEVDTDCLSDYMEIIEDIINDGNLRLVELLVPYCINVNEIDKNENTMLVYAIRARHRKIVKYLLEQGADIRHRNRQYYSIVDVSRDYSDDYLGQYIYDDIQEKLNERNNF